MANRQQVQRQIEVELESQGFHVSLLPWGQAHTTYYRPDGEALPGLPADAFSMQEYMRRGLTLFPPPDPLPTPKPSVGIAGLALQEEGPQKEAVLHLVAATPKKKRAKRGSKKGG